MLSFLRTFSLFVVSQREGIKPRRLYFKSLLRQDAILYDFQESGELTARIAINIKNYQDGIGPKFGMIFQISSMVITGCVIEFKKMLGFCISCVSNCSIFILVFTIF